MMRKKLLHIPVFIIIAAMLVTPLNVFSYGSRAVPSEEYDELIQFAELSTDIPLADGVSIEYLRENLFGSSIPNKEVNSKVMDLSEFRFPYHIEFDFGTRVVELAYIVYYTSYTLELGVKNIDFEYWDEDSGQWIKMLKDYDINYLNPGSESHCINLPTGVKASKYRLCINSANMEKKYFRIVEMEMYGAILGYTGIDDIKCDKPNYTLVKKGEIGPYLPETEVLTDSGDTAVLTSKWPEEGALTDEGLYVKKGNIEYYDRAAQTVFDVYDNSRTIDGSAGHWAEEYIEDAKDLGWLGNIYKGADQSLTREEAARILFRATGCGMQFLDGDVFSDIEDAADYYIINSLKKCGAYKGIAEDKFDGDAAVSRIEAVRSIMNLMNYTETAAVDFSDVSDEEKNLLSRAAAQGIVSNGSGFSPQNEVTLAEFVTMLMRCGDEKVMVRNYADTKEVVINPDMGIFSYYLDAVGTGYDVLRGPDDNYEDLEGLSVIYVRTFWSTCNPAEDVYDFSQIDALIQRAKKLNRQISFRFTSFEGQEYVAPKWVYDKGIEYYKWDYSFSTAANYAHPQEGDCWYYAPNYDDPKLLEYERKFFEEFGRRYDGHPQIAGVEMGIGLWGEGHMGSRLPEYSMESFIARMEMMRECLPNTPLAILNETEKGMGGDAEKWNTVKEKAKELEFGYRNDTYYGNAAAHGAYMWQVTEAHDAAKFSEWGPVIMELDHYNTIVSKGGFGEDKIGIAASIRAHHADYMGMHGPIRQMYEECPEFMENCGLNLGYRFIPQRIELPLNVTNDKTYDVNISWKNVGAANSHKDYYPAITLLDENGETALVTVDTDFSVRQLDPPEIYGAQGIITDELLAPPSVTSETIKLKLDKSVQPGKYKAYISVGHSDGEPVIAMPITGDNGERLYCIGDITVK